MHPRTNQFKNLLNSYSLEHDRRAVALEMAEVFIEAENVTEVLDVLSSLSAETHAAFVERVSQSPTSEGEWARLRIIRSNQVERDEAREKLLWRKCVECVRRSLEG